MRLSTNFLRTLFVTSIWFITSISSVQGSQFSPAIIVNDEFISKYEVNERRKLLLALGFDKKIAHHSAKENLIEETLQKLHAKTINIAPNNTQTDEVYHNYLSIRKITEAELRRRLLNILIV